MKQNKKKKGFTLIELMAVIAIIAILAAVLVPTVNGYINRSKKTALITQVREAVNAVETYNVAATEPIDPENTTVANLIAENSKLVAQELLETTDLDKLATGLKVEELQTINSDPDAVNNITKNNDGNFVYNNGELENIVIERVEE